MQNNISVRRACLRPLILFLFFFGLVSSASASTLTWNGGGADCLTSNPANWTGAYVPHDDDAVIFDNTSTKNCTWDSYLIPASLNLNPGYTGTVTLNSELIVTDSVIISSGTLTVNNTLSIGSAGGAFSPSAPSALSAVAVSSAQISLSWTDNSHYETGF